jgi:hypothetical protein
MDEVFNNSKGKQDLNSVTDPFGDPIDLGFRKGESTGNVTVNSENEADREVQVSYKIQDFFALGEQYNEIIDEGGIGQILPGPPGRESSSWDIHPEYKDRFEKFTPETGPPVVRFRVSKSYDPKNENLSDNYSNAHNVSPHKEQAADFRDQILQDEEGNLFTKDSQGNIVPYTP